MAWPTMNRRGRWAAALVIGICLVGVGTMAVVYGGRLRSPWSADEVATLQSLWLGSLPAQPEDPGNRYGDDPAAAALGHKIFFDTRFSSNGQVACATCHLPQMTFQDGLPLAQGVGVTNRRTMPIAGMGYSAWLFWDGRKDSLWSQALGPLENPVEHGGDRTQFVHLLAAHYRAEYEAVFGPLPDLSHVPTHAGPVDDPTVHAAWAAMDEDDRALVSGIYANLGKAIAAYERSILPGPSRFDAYVEAVLRNDRQAMHALLTPDEIAGLRLFIGEANCLQCHNGPLFTDNHFHNTGVPAVAGLPEDTGRLLGAQQVLADEFNCLGPYSDAAPEECAELRFMVAEGHELMRQFKAPSLRNAVSRAPYMHAGQFATLEAVLQHYNAAPAAPAGHSELTPLDLSERELAQLAAFLHTLDGPLAAPPEFMVAPDGTLPRPVVLGKAPER